MISKKMGRNSTCWCGSGKKYKKCHLNRETEKPVESWEASKEIRENFSVEVCSSPESFHDDCDKKIIKAHTIPKSTSLKAIAKNGHVYGFNFSLEHIKKNKRKIKPELIGINRASTFTGFCKFHDNKIFSPLEKHTFNSTQEQCFLLTYRSFSRECYTKNAFNELDNLRKNLDKGQIIEKQMEIQMKSFLVEVGSMMAINDNNYHKENFDNSLITKDYTNCHAVVLKFPEPPPVMVSGATNPDYDFDGNLIQDLMEVGEVPNLMAMNSFYDGKNGFIVFSWLDYCSKSSEELIKSLLSKPKNKLVVYLVQYIFKYFENSFVSPDWWDTVSNHDKEHISNLMTDAVSLDSEPSSYGIDKISLNIKFPEIINIEFIGWYPE